LGFAAENGISGFVIKGMAIKRATMTGIEPTASIISLTMIFFTILNSVLLQLNLNESNLKFKFVSIFFVGS
jgi:hypothetical protein